MNVTETIVVNDAATLERSDTVSRNAILAVSFGTVHTETRDKTIGAIEQAMREGFPGWEVRRALTSTTILRKLAAAGEPTANLWQALGQLREESVSRVVCQSTYVVNGEEQETMVREAEKCAHWFDQLVCGTPLLTSQEDLEAVARAIEEMCIRDRFGYYHHVSCKEFGGTTGDVAGWFLPSCELALLAGMVLLQKWI